jgi:TonB family protein
MKNKNSNKQQNPFLWLKNFMAFTNRGWLLWAIELSIIFFLTAGIFISGISFSSEKITRVYDSDTPAPQDITRVSKLPEKKKEDSLSEKNEDEQKKIQNKYYRYVISRIEALKVYPKDEQKKGHEGSVLLELHLNKSGKIQKVIILQQARFVKLTNAAINSLKKANPFKAFPKDMNLDQLIITVRISFFLE